MPQSSGSKTSRLTAVNLAHDGLQLWYDTPDAPAPPAQVRFGNAASLTVGVQPASPINMVTVRYRVDGGRVRTLDAREIRTNYQTETQYFRADFPSGLAGTRVDYCPVASCAGRQVPRPGTEDRMLSSFVIAKSEVASRVEPSAPVGAMIPRFKPELDLVSQITVELKPPTVFGKTPLGFRIDYHAKVGIAIGYGFRAAILDNSADYMIVRPDGIAMLDVHATLRTDDGALIAASYGGMIDFGEDGYEGIGTGNVPDVVDLQVSPRLTSADPRYRWMNRTYFIGVGQVDMRALVFKYDTYALKPGVQPGAWAR
jgi:hypothetical protein